MRPHTKRQQGGRGKATKTRPPPRGTERVPARKRLLDRLELGNNVPNQRTAMERDVWIVREVVHDHNRARDSEVKRFTLLRKSCLCLGGASADVPRDGRVFRDLVEDVHDLL